MSVREATVSYWLKSYRQGGIKALKNKKRRTKSEDVVIHWGYETGSRNTKQHGRSYAPKGKTLVKKNCIHSETTEPKRLII